MTSSHREYGWWPRIVLALAVLTLASVSTLSRGALAGPCDGFGITHVSLTSALPVQFSAISKSQLGADCLAWQEFVALNWRADLKKPGYPDNAPPTTFGTPGDISPKVWESYLQASEVFKARAEPALRFEAVARPAIKQLSLISKFGDAIVQLNGIGQAGNNKWLTDQRGDLTFYEIRLNQDEYDFVTRNIFSGSDLTTFAGQIACAMSPGQNGRGGLALPAGSGTDVDCRGKPATYGQDKGSIEIKASWVKLPDNHSLDYRFETAVAELTDPFGVKTKATVGLVGLHIIHKMPGANQFVWATFEQIDNDPDLGGGKPSGPVLPSNSKQKARSAFTYYNPGCNVATDPFYKCVPNTMPGTPCLQGSSTKPAGCVPYVTPVPVARVTPVEQTANAVTGYAWSLLPANSVFNYYRLIDVQWPNAPSPIAPGSVTPLTTGDITPNDQTRIVAGSASETYLQKTTSCMDCHKYGDIAQASRQLTAVVADVAKRRVLVGQVAKPSSGTPDYASDYSFIFSTETTH